MKFSRHFFGYIIMLLFFMSPYAQAAYNVTPRIIDETIEARDIITKTITLENTGTQPYTIYPTVNNISLEEGGDIQKFLPPVESDRTSSLSSWLEINRLGIDLMPGMKKEITLTIRVHPEPKPGTYHAFIGFPYGGTRPEAESQLQNGNVPGVVINALIEEDTIESLKLSKFIINRFVTKIDNGAASFSFVNPGETPVIPKGEIILYDSTGKEVGMLPVNNENVTIQSGETFTFTDTIPIEGLLGKYKAYLSVEYGTQQASIQDTSFFYVFPINKLLILFGIVSCIIVASSWYVHKKYLDKDAYMDDSDRLTMHIRDTESEPIHHDINLKKSNDISNS